MTFRASVLTLYPEMFPGALGMSLAGRALEAGTLVAGNHSDPRLRRQTGIGLSTTRRRVVAPAW